MLVSHDLSVEAADHQRLFAPVELKGVTELERERHEGALCRLAALGSPAPDELGDPGVAPSYAGFKRNDRSSSRVTPRPVPHEPTSGLTRSAKRTAGMNHSAALLRSTWMRMLPAQCGQTFDLPNRLSSLEKRLTLLVQCGHFMGRRSNASAQPRRAKRGNP